MLKDHFVYELQFTQRELLRQQAVYNIAIGKLTLQTLHCHTHDFTMVICKLWQMSNRKPINAAILISCLQTHIITWDKSKVRNRNNTTKWITLHITKCVKLFKIYGINTCFFFKLSFRCCIN